MRLWAAFVSMTEGHFIQVSSLTVGSVVWKGQKGERPLRVAVRQELLVFVTCWRGNEKEFVAARCTNASSVPFIISLLNLPSEANPQTPDSEVYVLQAAVSVSLSIVSSLLHFSWFTLFQASEAARSQVTDTWWRRRPVWIRNREKRQTLIKQGGESWSDFFTGDSFLCWLHSIQWPSSYLKCCCVSVQVCILQRSVWRPIMSQHRVKSVPVWRLLQRLLLLPVSGGRTATILHGLTYPKILYAPEKEERKTENGDVAWCRSSLPRARAAEIVT